MLSLSLCGIAAAQSSYELRSPDNRIQVKIRAAEKIQYDVLLGGRTLLENSTFSLDVEHKALGLQPKVVEAKERANDEVIKPTVRQKFAQIRDNYKELRLTMDGGYSVAFRAYNEGVAYRVETGFALQQVKVYGEQDNWNFPSNFVVYYPQEDSFFSHNERKYLPQFLTGIGPGSLATLPAVVDARGTKIAIAESDVEDYPSLRLSRRIH